MWSRNTIITYEKISHNWLKNKVIITSSINPIWEINEFLIQRTRIV